MFRKRYLLAGLITLTLGLVSLGIVSVNAQEYRSRNMTLADRIRQAFGGSSSSSQTTPSNRSRYSGSRKITGTANNLYQNRHPQVSGQESNHQHNNSGNYHNHSHMSNEPDDLVVHERSGAPTSSSSEPTPASQRPTPANRTTAFAEASDYGSETSSTPTPAPRRSDYTPRTGSNVGSSSSSSSREPRIASSRVAGSSNDQPLSTERAPTPAAEPKPVAAKPTPASPTPVTPKPSSPTPATSPLAAGSQSSSRRSPDPQPEPTPEPQPAPQPIAASSRDTTPERGLFESSRRPSDVPKTSHVSTPAASTTPAATKPAVGGLLLSRRMPALSVETAGPQKIVLGREAHYKLTLKNTGSDDAHDVTVAMAIPSWAEVVGTYCSRGTTHVNPQPNGPTVQWQAASLTSGGSETLEVTLLPRESRAFDLNVQVSSAPVVAHASVQVLEPKLQLAINGPTEVSYGEKAVYRLTFSNPGTASAEDVKIRLFPVDDSRDVETYEIGTLPAGGKKVAEVELVARQRGELMIRAQASALGDLTVEAQQPVLVRRPDVRLAVEGPRFQFARTIATYTLRVSNPGNDVARNVQVGAVLPREAVYVSSNMSGKHAIEEKESRVRWVLPALEPGAEQVLELRCELALSGMNRLEAVCAAEGDLRDATSVTTEVEAVADLALDLVDPSGPVAVGDELTYEITVHNRGTKASEAVELLAILADDIEPVSVEGARHTLSGQEVRIASIPQVAAGEKVRVKIRAKGYSPGNHVVRVELSCPALGTRLSVQEATRFYGEAQQQPVRTSAQPTPAPTSAPRSSRFFPTQDGSSQSSPTEAQPPSFGEPTPAGDLSPIPDSGSYTPGYGEPTPAAGSGEPNSAVDALSPRPASRYGEGASSRNQSSRYPNYR